MGFWNKPAYHSTVSKIIQDLTCKTVGVGLSTARLLRITSEQSRWQLTCFHCTHQTGQNLQEQIGFLSVKVSAKVLYGASALAVNCSSMLTCSLTNYPNRGLYDSVMTLWMACCLQVPLNLSLNFPHPPPPLGFTRGYPKPYSWFARFSAWSETIWALSITQLPSPSVISTTLCHIHGNSCNNTSAGNDNNNSQRHI